MCNVSSSQSVNDVILTGCFWEIFRFELCSENIVNVVMYVTHQQDSRLTTNWNKTLLCTWIFKHLYHRLKCTIYIYIYIRQAQYLCYQKAGIQISSLKSKISLIPRKVTQCIFRYPYFGFRRSNSTNCEVEERYTCMCRWWEVSCLCFRWTARAAS